MNELGSFTYFVGVKNGQKRNVVFKGLSLLASNAGHVRVV